MRRVLILLFLCLLTGQAARLGRAERGWVAGVAEGKITPPVGTHLIGFEARPGPSKGVHDDLYVRALVVERGGTAVALVEADLVQVTKVIADKVRNEASKETGIPAGHILIAATHTHGGPGFEGAYGEFFVRTAVATVVRAWRARQAARIGAGAVTHRGWVGMNRRHLESGLGPVDKEISILEIADAQGRPQAILYNYSCHAACLGPDNLLVTADWPYYVQGRIQSKLGGGVKVLYFQGTEGDVNTGYSAGLSSIGVPIPTRTYAYAQELGETLADAILAGLASITLKSDGPVEARDDRVNIEYYVPMTLAEADGQLEQARAALHRLEEQHARQSQLNDARVAVSFAQNNRERVGRNLKAPARSTPPKSRRFASARRDG